MCPWVCLRFLPVSAHLQQGWLLPPCKLSLAQGKLEVQLTRDNQNQSLNLSPQSLSFSCLAMNAPLIAYAPVIKSWLNTGISDRTRSSFQRSN